MQRKEQFMKTRSSILSVLIIGSMLVPPAANAHDYGDRWPWLGGVWKVKVAPKNCTTGAPLPAPPFVTLFTFNDDGTLLGSLQNYAVSATNRSASHGQWKAVNGGRRGEFVIKFTHLRYDFVSGVYFGTQEAVSQLQLGRSGQQFTASSTAKGFDLNGMEVFKSCADLAGDRIEFP
jgi:hypothetical protein